MEKQLEFLESLPDGLSLMCTFERNHRYSLGGAVEQVVDYSRSFAGPAEPFLAVARLAKARGARLYAMANTGGLTWDCGVVPCEPMPQQWGRRFQALLEAREAYELCGLMESHHYGFYPSFVNWGNWSN
jgi:hypothetical protein